MTPPPGISISTNSSPTIELSLKQQSAILGHYGWESPEHLKWRRETLEQDSLMRESVDAYIAREGFPVWVQPKPVRIASDTTGGAPVRYEYKKVPNPAYITFLILSTAPTFTERCGNLSLLEFEWERGSIGDANFHGYLESTHRSWKGEELEIATGTTERDRIRQYLLALDGCR